MKDKAKCVNTGKQSKKSQKHYQKAEQTKQMQSNKT